MLVLIISTNDDTQSLVYIHSYHLDGVNKYYIQFSTQLFSIHNHHTLLKENIVYRLFLGANDTHCFFVTLFIKRKEPSCGLLCY